MKKEKQRKERDRRERRLNIKSVLV